MWFSAIVLGSFLIISFVSTVTGIVMWYNGEDVVSSLILANLGICAFGITYVAAETYDTSMARMFRGKKE